jgi:hypothetical protein
MVSVILVFVPVQLPVQPVKVEPVEEMAIRVAVLFSEKLLWQVVPQLILVSVVLTSPVPVLVIVRVNGFLSKVAVQLLAAFIIAVVLAVVPVHAPLQLTKVESLAGVATKVTVLVAKKPL